MAAALNSPTICALVGDFFTGNVLYKVQKLV
jgi:hypothetical protein